MKSELPFLPVARLASLLDRKEISPVEIVTALLERIDRYSARLRSYITVCADSALEAARRAEKEIVAGRRWGPLHGIPVSHKDISWTKGVLTTAHSRAMLDHVPE
ncbi:MAG: hypothetical protein HY660_17625, partial [Armatimonadetes bacterium]|nr:hypothetical protein [Armatimonadota bacterium]